jgi:hypothetical protein
VAESQVSRERIKAIIEGDSDDLRFETFCADIFSEREGIDYETTAQGGDLGTDARGTMRLTKGSARICATTEKRGFRAKAEWDIDRLALQGTAVARLHICFSRAVKEEVLREMEKYARQKFPDAEDIEAHSSPGLSDIAFRDQRPFLDNYARELAEQQLWLRGQIDEGDEGTDQVNVLRIALTTVFHPEITRQKELITQNMVLTALESGESKNVTDINAIIAQGLGLQRPPLAGYIVSAVDALMKDGLVETTPRGIRLTTAGSSRLEKLVALGAKASLDAKASFKFLLGSVEKDELTAAQFSRVWRSVQRHLSNLFLNNGLRVVGELQRLASGESGSSSPLLLTSALQHILDEVFDLELPIDLQERIVAVVRDMLQNAHSPAFQWISDLGIKYVVICALGLDPRLEQRIRDRVSQWVVVPDTHVVLSYLCTGDEGYGTCWLLLRQLHRLQGVIWLCQAVAEECTNHAEISAESFFDWYERVRIFRKEHPREKVTPYELIDPADNAFIKGFAHRVGEEFTMSDWRWHLSQFVSARTLDTTKITSLLHGEIGAEYKPDNDMIRRLGAILAGPAARSSSADKEYTQKCEWDGKLLASCVLNKSTIDRRLLIVSDSERIRKVFQEHITAELKEGISITDAASLSYALSIVPGTSVTLECVKHCLFGRRLTLDDGQVSRAVLTSYSTSPVRILRHKGLLHQLDEELIIRNSENEA